MFWANREQYKKDHPTYVLEIGDGFSRLILRSKRTVALNWLLFALAHGAYYGIFIAIAVSPPYQEAQPWRIPGFVPAILSIFLMGAILDLIWSAWWVPRFSASNPVHIIDVKISSLKLGRLRHQLIARAGESEFVLLVNCPRRRLARALDWIGPGTQ